MFYCDLWVVSLYRVGAQNGLQEAGETRAIRTTDKSPTRYRDTTQDRIRVISARRATLNEH